MPIRTIRIMHQLEATVGSLIWLMNAYRIATGWGKMTILDAVCAGMIFLFGPLLVWESIRKIK